MGIRKSWTARSPGSAELQVKKGWALGLGRLCRHF